MKKRGKAPVTEAPAEPEVKNATVPADFGTVEGYEKVERLPTGSLSLDIATGGGWARGRFNSISGWEGSGKSTIAVLAARETIANGGMVAIGDAEQTWDVDLAQRSGMGLPGKQYKLHRPPTAEMMFRLIKQTAEEGKTDLFILDSWAALSPAAEYYGEIEDQHMMLLPRVASHFFRWATGHIHKSGMAVLITNQLRVSPNMYEQVVRPGGKALRFNLSIACDTDRPKAEDRLLNQYGDTIGMTIRGKFWKNKTASNFRAFEFDVLYRDGLCVDKGAELAFLGLKYGLFFMRDGSQITSKNAGSAIYCFQSKELGQKKEVIQKLRSDTDLALAVRDEIFVQSGIR